MAVIYQRNRQYSLVVGTASNAFEVTNLQITFRANKTSSNKDKKNKAHIEIYNLSKDHQALLEQPYVAVVLSVGYEDTGLKRLFAGQAFSVGTKKQGPDTITEIDIEAYFTELNFKTVSKLVPAGKTVRQVIQELIKEIPEVSKSIFNGENIKKTVVDGYPMSGNPRRILDDISRAYKIDWQIDDGVLFISDEGDAYTNDKNTAFLIHERSGLIERPYYETKNIKDPSGRKVETVGKDGKSHKKIKKVPKKSIRLKILMNPAIYAGSIIRIEYGDFTGFYKVDEVQHEGDFRGDTWYSEIKCSERVLDK